MVDVSGKPPMLRKAVAKATVQFADAVIFDDLVQGRLMKGDALAAARLAAITGAKQTGMLIPLCHSALPLSVVQTHWELLPETHALDITVHVAAVAPTGVEMEALTGVSMAALTVYDMCKSLVPKLDASYGSSPIRIERIVLLSKTKETISDEAVPSR